MNIRDQIIGNLDNIEYVSFDIFDTLVFRMVRRPFQIFDKMHEASPKLFPERMSGCEWRHMRIYAEADAKEKKKGGEITLEDIYNELPGVIKDRRAVMELEIRTELDNAFLNPEMGPLLKELKHEYGKKIILTSDMYLSRQTLGSILQSCDLDISLLEEIFVSSQCGVKKSDGKLFSYISGRLGCGPERILHIGDNWKADFLNARKAGWKSVYYPLISEADCRHPYLGYEREYYGDVGSEIYAMRLLAARSHNMEGREKEWFEMGAMALGPLLTYGTEWVLDTAEKEGIRNVYPMMREGFFLAQLLKNAAKERNWQGTIEPMYVSRKALYPALNAVIKKKDVINILNYNYMTVREAVRLLGIDVCGREYLEKYWDLELEECKNIFFKDGNLYELLKKELTSEETLEEIRTGNAGADEAIWNYFMGLKMDKEDYITFDIGWKGTTQNAIERLSQNRGGSGRGIHLLLLKRLTMLKNRNLEEGAEIRGFVGNTREGNRRKLDIQAEVFEVFFTCGEGTTTGYRGEGRRMHPVCSSMEYGEDQLRLTQAAQEGILSFQKVYFSLKGVSRKIAVQDGEELFKMAARLIRMPMRGEARRIGAMFHDENAGVDRICQVIHPDSLKWYGKLGYNRFVHERHGRAIEWYDGMEAVIDGLVFYKEATFHMRNSVLYRYAMYAERICGRFKRFVLVGAGMRARTLLMFLKMMDEDDRVEFIADNDPCIQGERICGKKVRFPQAGSESGCYCLTTMERKTISELERQLKGISPHYTVYHIYS